MRPFAATALLLAGLLALGGCNLVEGTLRGPQPATWGLAGGQEIDAGTTLFVAMVTERECASGQSSEGRVVGPEINYTDDSVVISFEVRPLGGGQDCQGNPSTRVEVRLDEPLGERLLLDGFSDPPHVPPVCQSAEYCE